MKLGIKKLSPRAVMPEFKTDGAACFDLVAISKTQSGNTCNFGIGLAFDIPDGYHLKVYSRSGQGFNDGMTLVNSVGIIDSDYTGEVGVKLVRQSGEADWPYVGDRVAQAMLVKNVKTELVEVDQLKVTERGDGGFGSTGR